MMKTLLTPLFFLLGLFFLAGCTDSSNLPEDPPETPTSGETPQSSGAGSKPSTLVTGGYDQVEMAAAVMRARSEIDQFLEVLASREADSFLVKVPITEGEYTEHFWVKDVSFADGMFKGVISNDPGNITTVTYGQEWTVPKEEITDWIYNRGDKMHGGYTIEPLLHTMAPEQADAIRQRLVR